jgi:mRNA interferase YafQ
MMIRKVIFTPRFQRSLKKFAKGNIRLEKQIKITLQEMEADIFTPSLATHLLKGEFAGLRACSCGYDCRIIFSIEKDEDSEEETLVLLNIGSHDDVY